MASPGSAKSTMSPGRMELKSTATPWPARACSREVRGSWMPCLAKTHLVNPEQSKPLCGVLPPHVYGVPTYSSAVLSTRVAVALGAGDRGMLRVFAEPRDVVVVLPELVLRPIASPARMTVERIVEDETP